IPSQKTGLAGIVIRMVRRVASERRASTWTHKVRSDSFESAIARGQAMPEHMTAAIDDEFDQDARDAVYR
ncbi:hypothetical protein EOB49_36335, partial [Mesorhizobium sp. M7A.F.Ca.MR.148.00.0.0]